MKIKELAFPVVQEKDGRRAGYGGNQDWFPDEWQRKAGCGCTNAANMAAYYGLRIPGMEALYEGRRDQIRKEDYLALMEEMYRRMTPGVMGYPYPARMGRQFAAYAKERGAALKPVVFCRWKDWREGFSHIREAIDRESPLGLLILFHRAPELQEDIWHWVTVTGYGLPETEEEEAVVILSDCGERDSYKARVLLEVHRKNTLKMLTFVPEESAAGQSAGADGGSRDMIFGDSREDRGGERCWK